jgi:hypothetical protein
MFFFFFFLFKGLAIYIPLFFNETKKKFKINKNIFLYFFFFFFLIKVLANIIPHIFKLTELSISI